MSCISRDDRTSCKLKSQIAMIGIKYLSWNDKGSKMNGASQVFQPNQGNSKISASWGKTTALFHVFGVLQRTTHLEILCILLWQGDYSHATEEITHEWFVSYNRRGWAKPKAGCGHVGVRCQSEIQIPLDPCEGPCTVQGPVKHCRRTIY